ncbi:hypothetical protein KCP75_05780 [Salmonella enterica subsp. enterica]|nr:hypothetical protein KCP75_05780 [Salmonella enterica subsp. enterica]
MLHPFSPAGFIVVAIFHPRQFPLAKVSRQWCLSKLLWRLLWIYSQLASMILFHQITSYLQHQEDTDYLRHHIDFFLLPAVSGRIILPARYAEDAPLFVLVQVPSSKVW